MTTTTPPTLDDAVTLAADVVEGFAQDGHALVPGLSDRYGASLLEIGASLFGNRSGV